MALDLEPLKQWIGPRGVAVVEEQDLVYRGEPDENALALSVTADLR